MVGYGVGLEVGSVLAPRARSMLGGIEDARTKEFEAGSAVHRPLQHLDPTDLAFDGTGGPGQVEGSLYGIDVLAQRGGKARERRGARGGQHIIERLAALPSQKEGQPLCGRDRRSERGDLVQQPRHERSVGLGQRVGPTHQQAGHAAARRPSPSLSLIRGGHPAHVGLSLAPLCGPSLDGGVATREALTRQLAPQAGRVAASLGPPPLQVIAVCIEHAAPLRLAPGWDVSGPQPSLDRSAIGSEAPRDLAEGGARRLQANGLLEVGAPARVRRWAARCRGRIRPLDCRRNRRGYASSLLRSHLRRDPPDGGVVIARDRLDGVTEVAQQMPPVRDLDRVGRSLPDAIGVDAGAVARDDLHPRVLLQPRRQAFSSAVGQQVEDPVPLQVDEDGPIAVTAPPRPIIDPEHARRRAWHRRGIATARHAQQRVRAGGDSQPRREACASLSAHNEAEVALQIAQPARPTRGRPCRFAEALGKGSTQAGRVQAPEASDANAQRHWTTLPRQVAEPAGVAAVHAARQRSTVRTSGRLLTCGGDDGEMVGGGKDLLDQQPCRDQR